MTGFLVFLGIIGYGGGMLAVGFILGNYKPMIRKEIQYVQSQRYVSGEHRIIPEHPPIPKSND